MTDIEDALAEALRHVDGPDPDLDGKPSDDMTNGEFAAAILATEPMQAALRALAKDIGATAYAEGLHDAETNPERDRDAAVGRAVLAMRGHAFTISHRRYTNGRVQTLIWLDDDAPMDTHKDAGRARAVIAAALGDDDDEEASH